MKILPDSNILHINKKYTHRPSFRAGWIEEDKSNPTFNAKYPRFPFGYTSTDSYVDETGLHFVRNRNPFLWAEQINESIDEAPVNKSTPKQNDVFITQELYEQNERKFGNNIYSKSRQPVMNALYNLDLEELKKALDKLDSYKRDKITEQPFFLLGLADMPLNDSNNEFFKKIADEMYIYKVNFIDENGITLLEKVMNAENGYLLNKIVKSSLRSLFDSNLLAYHKMQKYAFNNIQNPEFKKECSSLPIYFTDIIDDIKRKDFKSLDKHVQEQMTCGFCSIDFALSKIHKVAAAKYDESYYATLEEYSKTYSKMVLDIIKKVFPKEVAQHLKETIIV